jgi:hypothetical protein
MAVTNLYFILVLHKMLSERVLYSVYCGSGVHCQFMSQRHCFNFQSKTIRVHLLSTTAFSFVIWQYLWPARA